MSSVARVPHVVAHDEIDLLSIFRTLWRRRLLIVAVALLAAACGAGYAMLATPVYETSSLLRPVALNDLDALNRSQVYKLPPREALKRVGETLDSYEARLSFFRSRPELIEAYGGGGQSIEQAFDNFNNQALKVLLPDPKQSGVLSPFVGLKIRYEEGLDGAGVLNDFISFAIQRQRAQLTDDLKVIVDNRLSEVDEKLAVAVSEYEVGKESKIARLLEDDAVKRARLQDELKALRVQLKLRRQARLAQLDEAISIARSLGLKKPSTPSGMADEPIGGGNIVRTEINNQQFPLYFMGTEVLEAERNALRKRGSDDFVEPRIAEIRKELVMLENNRKIESLKARQNEQAFLEGIETLRVERARLKAINTDMSQLRLVNVDQLAVAPSKPIKPRKALIVAVAFVLGLLLGAATALLRGAFKARLNHLRTVDVDGAIERVPMPGLVTNVPKS